MAPWAHLVLLVHLLGFQQHLGIANGLVGPSHELRKGIGGTSVTSTGNGLVYRGKRSDFDRPTSLMPVTSCNTNGHKLGLKFV